MTFAMVTSDAVPPSFVVLTVMMFNLRCGKVEVAKLEIV